MASPAAFSGFFFFCPFDVPIHLTRIGADETLDHLVERRVDEKLLRMRALGHESYLRVKTAILDTSYVGAPMEGLARDLVVGVLGSIIGAVLISLFAFGLRFTTTSRAARRASREREILDWKSGDVLKRQRIFNWYLFSVLKLFITGSILIAVSNAVGDLHVVGPSDPLSGPDYLFTALDAAGALFYLATFSRILMFTRLLKSEP